MTKPTAPTATIEEFLGEVGISAYNAQGDNQPEDFIDAADKAIAKGYSVYGASASFTDELILAKEKYELPFDFLFCDGTTLKTMVRANPGIMMLQKGTIMGKWNWSDADEIEL